MGALLFPRSSAHGIPVACGSGRCPRGDYVGRPQVLPKEDAEMKPPARGEAARVHWTHWALAGVSHAGPGRVATP